MAWWKHEQRHACKFLTLQFFTFNNILPHISYNQSKNKRLSSILNTMAETINLKRFYSNLSIPIYPFLFPIYFLANPRVFLPLPNPFLIIGHPLAASSTFFTINFFVIPKQSAGSRDPTSNLADSVHRARMHLSLPCDPSVRRWLMLRPGWDKRDPDVCGDGGWIGPRRWATPLPEGAEIKCST